MSLSKIFVLILCIALPMWASAENLLKCTDDTENGHEIFVLVQNGGKFELNKTDDNGVVEKLAEYTDCVTNVKNKLLVACMGGEKTKLATKILDSTGYQMSSETKQGYEFHSSTYIMTLMNSEGKKKSIKLDTTNCDE